MWFPGSTKESWDKKKLDLPFWTLFNQHQYIVYITQNYFGLCLSETSKLLSSTSIDFFTAKSYSSEYTRKRRIILTCGSILSLGKILFPFDPNITKTKNKGKIQMSKK